MLMAADADKTQLLFLCCFVLGYSTWGGCRGFNLLITRGIKLFRSLVVWARRLQYLLPEGKRQKKEREGWKVSLRV